MAIEGYLHYDINLYAVFLLLALLGVMRTRRDTSGYASRLFIRVMVGAIVLLLVEILSWYFDRRVGDGMRSLNYVANALFFWLSPLVPCLWSAHVDFRIFRSRERLRRRHYYCHGMILSSALLIINAFYPIVFTVDALNRYSRLHGMWIVLAFAYAQVGYMAVLSFRNREHSSNQLLATTFVLAAAPALGAVFQLLYFGALVIWPLVALALTITYVLLETVTSSRDYMTGLSNRQTVDRYVERLVENKTPFGLVVIDLDDFKEINDGQGHQAGDRYLAHFATVLSHVFSNERMVGRHGGDEFVVITRVTNRGAIERYQDSLRLAILATAIADIDAQYLRFSYGYSVFNGEPGVSFDDVFYSADRSMYAEKASNKNQLRRSSDRPRRARNQLL